MKIAKIVSVVFLSFVGAVTHAQQDPMFTHYMYNTLSVNPAYAGSRDALSVTTLHRSQWVGLRGAPMTQTLTMHSPIGVKNVGLGLAVSNDRIGPVNNTLIAASFAYTIKLNQKSKLNLGLSGGGNILQADLSNLELDNQNDPSFQNNLVNQFTPSFGFGAYYSRERFYAGLSTPNLLENTYHTTTQPDGNVIEAKARRHYFFIAGAIFDISNYLAFKPTTLVKVTSGAPAQVDFTASFILNKKLLLGAMYRTGDAIGALIGINITQQFYVGYSYDWSMGFRTPIHNHGSHEVMLRYDFIFNSKNRIQSPRYF